VKSLGGYYELRRVRPKGVGIVGVVADGTVVEEIAAAAHAFVDAEREGDVE
jgi:hypothetical protein